MYLKSGYLYSYINNFRGYRFSFNGQERDDEIAGVGNSSTTEFRQYDPRIGRWLSIDPLFQHFPWQSPYVAFDDNPVLIIDPKGLAGENSNGDDERKKERIRNKINRLEKKNAKELIGLNPIQRYDFLKEKYRNKFARWEKINEESDKTGWNIKAETEKGSQVIAKKRIQFPLGTYIESVDLNATNATLELKYDMLGYENKLDIFNEETGELIYTTGYKLNKDGSGAKFDVNLGTTTKIMIVANDGVRGDMGFKFKLTMHRRVVSKNLDIKKAYIKNKS